MSETTTEEQRCPVLNIDMEVSFQALTLDLLYSYEKLEPFGNSNPQPLVMSSDVFPTEPPRRVVTNHLKLVMRQGIVERDAIFFNGAQRELPNPPWDIACTIDRNVYRGQRCIRDSHNSDQGPNGHGYRREESVEIEPVVKRVLEAAREGKIEKDVYKRQESGWCPPRRVPLPAPAGSGVPGRRPSQCVSCIR